MNVTVYCEKDDSVVRTTGSIIHLSELEILLKETEIINKKLDGESNLPCIEPNLYINIKMKESRRAEMIVNIKPDYLNQTHKFIFEIDQSYFPKLISQLSNILKKYTIRGKVDI